MSQSSLFKQERRGDSQSVIANRLARQQALCNRRKMQGGSQRERVVTDLVYCLAQRTRSYENQSAHRAVSKFVKTAINTAITGKLLKSKVTLLNTCEKLKMTQRDTGNISRRSMRLVTGNMRLVIVKHVTIRLKCGSGWSGSTERIWG